MWPVGEERMSVCRCEDVGRRSEEEGWLGVTAKVVLWRSSCPSRDPRSTDL